MFSHVPCHSTAILGRLSWAFEEMMHVLLHPRYQEAISIHPAQPSSWTESWCCPQVIRQKKICGIFLQALVQYSCLLIKTNSAEKHCKSSGKELTLFYDAVVYWEISRVWNMPCSTIQRKTAVPPCSGVLRESKLSAHRKQVFHLSWKVLLMLILQTVTEHL